MKNEVIAKKKKKKKCKHPPDELNFANFVSVSLLMIIDGYDELISFQRLLGKEVERKKFAYPFIDFKT